MPAVFFKEREVLASFATIAVGLVLLVIGLVAGNGGLTDIGTTFVVTGVAALGIARGLAKIGTGGLLWLLAVPLALLPACGNAGMVRADALLPVTEKIAERHDAYVSGDASLSEVDRRIFLRSTELLLQTLRQAVQQE